MATLVRLIPRFAQQRLSLALCVAALVFGGTGCRDKEPADASEKPSKVATPPVEAPAAETSIPSDDARPASERLLDWVDPEATAVSFSRLPANLDMQTMATVFALPPRVSRMLRDTTGTTEGLAAILGPDQPHPDQWLGPEALAMTPAVGTGTYVVRPLLRPDTEVQAILRAAGMRARTIEGMTVLEPTRALPWRLVFLPGDLVGFIPTTEIGSGLSPLTAARDMPPSAAENELRKALGESPQLLLELLASGPMLHLDLDQDVISTRFRLSPLGPGAAIDQGLDAMVAFQPARDVDQAAKALEARTVPLETDVVGALVDRVAFTVEGDVVQGRLQLNRSDLDILREAS